VVSYQVHLSLASTPAAVTILTTADAGETFYGRSQRGEIIHLDIFHAVADVDHRQVAAALRQALGSVPAPGAPPGGPLLLDYLDLCTGTGAGRVTGDLNYGQKPSLRAAHRNHVHLAGLLNSDGLQWLLPLVSTVEQAILAQGVELRRIERLQHAAWTSGSPLDLSDYTEPEADSWLRGSGASGCNSPGRAGPAQSLRAHRSYPAASHAATTAGASTGTAGSAAVPEGGSTPPADPHTDPGDARHDLAAPTGAGGTAGGGLSGWDALAQEGQLQAALDLSRRMGSPEELKRVLDELGREQGWASLYSGGGSQAPFVIRLLEEEGLVYRDLRGLRLTEAGKGMARFLERHLRDVKLRFRKLIRRLPASAAHHKSGTARSRPSPDVRYGPSRGTAPAEAGAWLGDIAVPETVRTALVRCRLEQSPLKLERKDIHVHLRAGEQPLHVCLLIDASASMAGRRILAAKHLARHLLVSTRDRIAVVSFQEREVRVHVPFTRDHSQVEEGLARIQPMGLTPLAHGLSQSLELIRDSRVRRPLLLLITDGIPTVARWTNDPLADGLAAARQIGQGRIPFGCIGLQPSRRYLDELVQAAGGTLHVVEELDEEALVSIAHQERNRLASRAR
jgi:Mg-chelatase subunit ChlD